MPSLHNALQLENIAPLDIYVHHLKSSVVINVAIAREVWATIMATIICNHIFHSGKPVNYIVIAN